MCPASVTRRLEDAGVGIGRRVLELGCLREKSVEQEDEFMIVEKTPLVNMFISSAPCNCVAFVAGIVRGVLEGAQFPAQVSAHEYEDSRTVILIKFAPEVLEREKRQAS